MGVFGWLFDTARFVPHGVCLLWRPDLVAIHVISDGVIALSYFAIPGAIWWFVRRRTDLEPAHRRIALLFVAFIALCGLTHVAAMVTLWLPYYGIQALLKLVTAVVSVFTAVALAALTPRLLAIPSPREMQFANARLQDEVVAHRTTLTALEDARRQLERQVADRDEDLRIVNARFVTALKDSTVTVFEQDEALRYTWVFNSPFGADAERMIGKDEYGLMAAPDAQAMQAIKRQALDTGEVQQSELRLLVGERPVWLDVRAQPAALRNGGRGLIVVATDITVQKRQHEHLQLLMRELNHRSKNLLAIVQTIARQTASGLDVPQAFLDRLGERLRALASAHDVLVESEWRGADLRAVIEGQLSHQRQGFGPRLHIDGPAVELRPEVAHYVGLAVHELGANAVKYGALSGEQGRVELIWSIDLTGAADRSLRLSWREFGGPEVVAPASSGFGRTILERLIPSAMRGKADLQFAPGGVAWTLTAPYEG